MADAAPTDRVRSLIHGTEALRRGHEESSMAPWWVLKKAKRF